MPASSDISAGFVPIDDFSSDSINFENLSFRDVDVRSLPSFLGSNSEELGQLLVEDVGSSFGLPIRSQLVLAPEYKDGVGLVEAISPLTQNNKETFTSILECFESANCSTVITCVSKSNLYFKSILSSFHEIGFSLAPCPLSSNYVWLSIQL